MDDRTTQRWGFWRIDWENAALVAALPAGDGHVYRYPVRLKEMTSAADVLTTAILLSRTNWGTNEVIGDFIRAMDELFGLAAAQDSDFPTLLAELKRRRDADQAAMELELEEAR